MGRVKTGISLEDKVSSQLDVHIQAFLAYFELEKGVAKNTALSYSKDISQFAIFLEKLGIDQWLAVSGRHVSLWLSELNIQDYSVASIARKLSALRMLSSFLIKEKWIHTDFTQLLTNPKKVRRLPGTLSMEEVDKLMKAPNTTTIQGLRDQAILELMYSSGLRVSELCQVTVQMLDTESGFIRVVGKGSKERGVPVGKHALQAIKRYLVDARPFLAKEKTGSTLFISQWGRPISRKTVWHMVQEYAKKIGIQKPIKPHALRHSFATHLLSNGANLRVIQEMLGHADISTTEIYTSVQTDQLVKAHQKHHPRSLF